MFSANQNHDFTRRRWGSPKDQTFSWLILNTSLLKRSPQLPAPFSHCPDSGDHMIVLIVDSCDVDVWIILVSSVPQDWCIFYLWSLGILKTTPFWLKTFPQIASSLIYYLLPLMVSAILLRVRNLIRLEHWGWGCTDFLSCQDLCTLNFTSLWIFGAIEVNVRKYYTLCGWVAFNLINLLRCL